YLVETPSVLIADHAQVALPRRLVRRTAIQETVDAQILEGFGTLAQNAVVCAGRDPDEIARPYGRPLSAAGAGAQLSPALQDIEHLFRIVMGVQRWRFPGLEDYDEYLGCDRVAAVHDELRRVSRKPVGDRIARIENKLSKRSLVHIGSLPPQ